MKRKSRLLALATALLCLGGSATAAEPALSAAAEDFIRAGAKSVIGACDIIARTCGEESLRTLEKGYGESPEEKRNWRKMQLRSLTVTATFPVQDPRRYYIELVRIDGPGWPIPQGLDIGSARTEVTARLGPPSRMDAAKCAVYFSESQVAGATFCFRSGQVSTISWEYLVD